MTSDDPFFTPQTDDRTIIRPVPGGKRSDIQIPASAPPLPRFSSPNINQALPRLGRLSSLENASSGLLALLTRINGSYSQSDTMELKNKIIQEIQQFQITSQAENIDPQTISSARYVMCTVLDEAVLNTPWGANSNWSQHSLLSLFHKEVSGGERFFLLLKSLAQNPAKNRGLLELMYLCLALGFEGRYRIMQDGKNKLLGIKEWLYQILQQERGSAEHALSPHWVGVIDQRNPLARFVPLWVLGAVAAALLAIMFSMFLLQLNRDSDPVFRQIFGIKPPVSQIVTSEPVYEPTLVPQITLSMLLAEEIENKQIKVVELVQRSTVTIKGDNLFSSGSTRVNRSLIPLLHRIAEALNQLAGEVLITGHSDNVPIRSSRYPSNWHLSKARAEAVANIIQQNLRNPDRVIIEGRSDLDPIATNNTREGRAKNRRVEVSLLK
ncbi:type VI secretion system protein TssL, long form [Methyloprofundus sp.]|uniref:type VI secretion system protein TssL, long form n=1 Tax=Methyloprofundus sp. TaxID=2020875 RepID=UPI003D122473